MATATASYGFERMQHMSDDDLEESASTRNLTYLASASYPSPAPASRKSRSVAASKSQDMKMVEIKHSSYDGGEGHHRRTATGSTTAPRRDYLREGHSPGERDHLLTQPTSPGRHGRPHHHAHTPSTSSSPSSSATSTATVTFTMTTSSSATSASYSSSSTYSYSAPSPPTASSPATLPSSGSLASSPPMLLVCPGSPKQSKKHHHHHHQHHHHHHKTKKRVTWVDESMEGTRLEEVIEVERYLMQHGSLGWWLELMWDNKTYFLLLLCLALLFLASLAFILYKLAF